MCIHVNVSGCALVNRLAHDVVNVAVDCACLSNTVAGSAAMAMFFGTFGDTVCQAAQAFLPPRIGTPARAWQLARGIFLCGVLIAVFNSIFGTLAAAYALPLFTASAAVQQAVWSALPLFSVQMLLHCCSMGTEGILLAARESAFLFMSYAAILGVVRVRPCTQSIACKFLKSRVGVFENRSKFCVTAWSCSCMRELLAQSHLLHTQSKRYADSRGVSIAGDLAHCTQTRPWARRLLARCNCLPGHSLGFEWSALAASRFSAL